MSGVTASNGFGRRRLTAKRFMVHFELKIMHMESTKYLVKSRGVIILLDVGLLLGKILGRRDTNASSGSLPIPNFLRLKHFSKNPRSPLPVIPVSSLRTIA